MTDDPTPPSSPTPVDSPPAANEDSNDVSHSTGLRRRRFIVAGTVAAIVIVIVAAVATTLVLTLRGGDSAKKLTMHGVLTVYGNGGPRSQQGQPCPPSNYGANPGVDAGAQVVVYSSSGKVVGAGVIGTGTTTLSDDGAPDGNCLFSFTVSGLPAAPYYQVEVAQAGRVAVQKNDLDLVALTIGG